MATIEHIRTQTQTSVAYVARWLNVANNDVCVAAQAAQYTEKSVQVFGTFGAGGQVVIQGSNDGVNWATLTDPQGNALTITAAKIEMVSEATHYIRPVVTGDGTTLLNILIMLKE